MKLSSSAPRVLRICLILLAVVALLAPASPLLLAQPSAHAAASSQNQASESVDSPESNKELQSFRHSAVVKKLAHHLGLGVETTAKLMEDINSAIMIGIILWLLFRTVPRLYRNRSEALEKQFSDARVATTEANRRLAAVEERLSRLDSEINEIRERSERDSLDDEHRVFASLETEKQRIIASAGQEIDAAGANARRSLQEYAAGLAVDRAMASLHLSEDDDRALIRTFGAGNGSPQNTERN